MSTEKDRFEADQGGASAIEFALVVPVFLMIALGILAYGVYFGAVHSTAQLAADAARASVAGLSDAERTEIASQNVATNSREYPLLDPAKIQVVAAPLQSDATQFRVAVRYDASALPIWGVSSLIPLPSQIIERTATVKRGGY